jgi:hypothetical protein
MQTLFTSDIHFDDEFAIQYFNIYAPIAGTGGRNDDAAEDISHG